MPWPRLLLGPGVESIGSGITAALYSADPDGHQMAFPVDSPNSSEDAAAPMASLLAENPIGIEFDPEEWPAGRQLPSESCRPYSVASK